MILPTKHIAPDRCLLTLGAEILSHLAEPKPVSSVWDRIRNGDASGARRSYSWFVLALDLLFVVGAIDYKRGVLNRVSER
jgi:hypothetical protein